MSIFDIFDKVLPGDQEVRHIKNGLDEYQHPSEGDVRDILVEPEEVRKFPILYLILAFGIIVLLIKLASLQIFHGQQYQVMAEGNRIRSKVISAPRGLFIDRKGEQLVKNTPSFDLVIYSADLPRDKIERQKIYQKVKDETGLTIEEITKVIEEKGLFSTEAILLKEKLDRDTAMVWQVKFVNTPGVAVQPEISREYPEQKLGLAQVLGYIGKINPEETKAHPSWRLADKIGKAGLEMTYQEKLKGIDGAEEVEVDSQGHLQRVLAGKEPIPGNNLKLYLDKGLQERMSWALAEGAKAASSDKAAAIAIDPRSGGILAMASYPYYDNNLFTKGSNSDEDKKTIKDTLENSTNPLLNRVISGRYPPGSSIKPIVAAAGLQEGVINSKTTIEDPGEIKIGNYIYPDWKIHGKVDVYKAIAESCNVFFYSVGGGWGSIKGLGVQKLDDYFAKFGFGQKLGIDLPGEEKGLIATPEWKEKNKNDRWYTGDTYHLSIGQGDFLVTPLQLGMAVSAIANGGELLVPHFVDKIISPGDKEEKIDKKIIRKDFISQENLKIVRDGMRQTITSGSGRALSSLSGQVAGKTGTAQFGSEGKTHAWFIAYAPADNPEIAIVVLVEGGGEGNIAAIPIAKEILSYWFDNR